MFFVVLAVTLLYFVHVKPFNDDDDDAYIALQIAIWMAIEHFDF